MAGQWRVVSGGGGGAPSAGASGPFERTLILNDTKPGPNIASNVVTYNAAIGQGGTIRRITGTLRKTITADLQVLFRVVYPDGSEHAIGTFTIPGGTDIDYPVVFTTFESKVLPDLAVLVPSIVSSDSSNDSNGIAAFTIEWVSRGAEMPTAAGIGWQGEWWSGTTYALNDMVTYSGKAYISLQDDNTGNQPDISIASWGLILEGVLGPVGPAGETGATGATGAAGSTGATGPGVAAGGTTGQLLKKNSNADYDTAWADPPTVGSVTETGISLSDVTTDNVSTTKHGFAPKLPNDATKYLDGTGAWTIPPGSSATGISYRGAWSGSTAYSVNDVVTRVETACAHLYLRLVAGTTATAPEADNTNWMPWAVVQARELDLAFTDITTNNASNTKHGLLPKLPNDSSKFLDGTGAWSTPAGGGGGGSVAFVEQAPSGTLNGVNVTFTLDYTPTSGSLDLSLNGVMQYPSINYTLSTNTITYVVPPKSTDQHLATYTH